MKPTKILPKRLLLCLTQPLQVLAIRFLNAEVLGKRMVMVVVAMTTMMLVKGRSEEEARQKQK